MKEKELLLCLISLEQYFGVFFVCQIHIPSDVARFFELHIFCHDSAREKSRACSFRACGVRVIDLLIDDILLQCECSASQTATTYSSQVFFGYKAYVGVLDCTRRTEPFGKLGFTTFAWGN